MIMLKSTKDKFTLAAAGDLICLGRLSIYDDPGFLSVIKILREADVASASLETMIHDYEGYPAAEPGGTWMRAPPFVADEIKWAGIDLLSCAQNHVCDFSYGGLFATMKVLDQAGIVYAGIGRNLAEARA